MTTASELAAAHGFAAAFQALRELRSGLGDPQPSDLLRLPAKFRLEVLGIDSTTNEALADGMARLWELVDDAPHEEAARLRMAFNFGREYGDLVWTKRVVQFAGEHGGDEKRLREKVDHDILQLLLRTREAAEKQPEVPAGAGSSGLRSTVGRFFDQDYVRNSQEFVDAWSGARSVAICGFGHNRMLVSYSSEIRALLRSGGSLRVLLQDPHGQAVLDANFRSSTPKASEEDVRHQHMAGLATLSALCRSAGVGSVVVRSYDIVPPFTAYFFDAESDGVAFVWFWSWRQPSSWRPGFVIRYRDDPVWFSRFYDQFSAMWSDEELTQAVRVGLS
ncbi:MAG: hypothetical protein QOJ79_2148 [Actinomycetota bacterium]|jgi:hypothetical protein|nr:hypothetical protein [Actinomycetota bacterium]